MSHKKKKLLAGLASLMLASSALPALAADGGAGSVGGNFSGGGGYTEVVHAFYDNAKMVDGAAFSDQGVGQNSTNWIADRIYVFPETPQTFLTTGDEPAEIRAFLRGDRSGRSSCRRSC